MSLQNLFRSYCAPLFYPLAQAFVLNNALRRFILCTPFWLFAVWRFVQLSIASSQFDYVSVLNINHQLESSQASLFKFYISSICNLLSPSFTIIHLAMLPFVLGIIWQVFKLGEKVLGEWQAALVPLILFCSPIMRNQAVLISADIFVFFFFLMALNAIFKKDKIQIALAILCLTLTSLNGILVAVALFLFDILNDRKEGGFKNLKAIVKPYLLGGISILLIFILYFTKKDWINPAIEILDFEHFTKKLLSLLIQISSFGNWISLLIMAICGFILRGGTFFKNTLVLCRLLSILLLLLVPTFLLQEKSVTPLPFEPLLPIYLIMNILCLKLISDLKIGKVQTGLYILFFIGLLLGDLR